MPHYIYSRESSGHSFFESKLDLSNSMNFPIDVVVLSDRQNEERKTRKVLLIKRHLYGTMPSLDDHKNVDCCRKNVIFSFYALNIFSTGKFNLINRSLSIWFTFIIATHVLTTRV